MPDHVHFLARFLMDVKMTNVVASWKRFTSSHAKINWQRDFFDHRLRGDEGWREKSDSILQNPVRAGLIEKYEDWRTSCCRPKGRDASPRRPKHPLKTDSWDGSESHPYRLEANVWARARCQSRSRACAARRCGSRFLLPFAPVTSADACSADNQPAQCVSPGRRGWRADSIF